MLLRKLRYDRRFGRPRVQGSGFSLPFADASFPCVLCSQVIEHVPKESPILRELVRVLRPGGRLVLGTPDYANWEWVVTEWLYGKVAPGAYADEHIAHYTRAELVGRFAALGFTHEATRYILRGELILAFRKGAGASAGGWAVVERPAVAQIYSRHDVPSASFLGSVCGRVAARRVCAGRAARGHAVAGPAESEITARRLPRTIAISPATCSRAARQPPAAASWPPSTWRRSWRWRDSRRPAMAAPGSSRSQSSSRSSIAASR